MVKLSWNMLEREAGESDELYAMLYCELEPSCYRVVHGDALEDLELDRESVSHYKNYLGPLI